MLLWSGLLRLPVSSPTHRGGQGGDPTTSDGLIVTGHSVVPFLSVWFLCLLENFGSQKIRTEIHVQDRWN